jgi:hypothetical protein
MKLLWNVDPRVKFRGFYENTEDAYKKNKSIYG